MCICNVLTKQILTYGKIFMSDTLEPRKVSFQFNIAVTPDFIRAVANDIVEGTRILLKTGGDNVMLDLASPNDFRNNDSTINDILIGTIELQDEKNFSVLSSGLLRVTWGDVVQYIKKEVGRMYPQVVPTEVLTVPYDRSGKNLSVKVMACMKDLSPKPSQP